MTIDILCQRDDEMLHHIMMLLLVAAYSLIVLINALSQQQQTYKPHLRAKIAHGVAKGERRARERSAQPRPVCSRCSRPPILCVCNVLPSDLISTAFTDILILQHPNEFRKRNLSTVPLIRLVLQNVQVRVGYSFDLEQLAPVQQALSAGVKPLLLYPGDYAISLDDASNDGVPLSTLLQHSPLNQDATGIQHLLIVVDGTWSEAKRMVRDSRNLLETCQQVQFASKVSSIYDAVRPEPDGHCLSTLEACAKALSYLEPTTAQEAVHYLHASLELHVKTHVKNAEILEPRNVGVAVQRLYEKNKRRREIEKTMFENVTPKTIDKVFVEPTRRFLGNGAILRSLETDDATLVDSWWDYQSAKSRSLVSRRIDIDGGVACLGIEVDGTLVACILRYEGGALGMLHVKEEYRRRGYAQTLLEEATRTVQARGEECIAFIVDGNNASEALFTKLGWVRADLHMLKKQTGNRRAKRKWVKQRSK